MTHAFAPRHVPASLAKKRLAACFSAMLTLAGSVRAAEPASAERLDEVARRGAQVMPFSLERTLHVFSKTDAGGVQRVIAKNASDAEQIRLIRAHLSNLAQAFRRGDFSDPASIHGAAMPGLAELRAAKLGDIRIAYAELADGAEIDYSTRDPQLIAVIHRWFDAQLGDHARHAMPGHDHGHLRKDR